MKQNIFSNHAPKPIGPYSQAIDYNGLLFISGQIGIDTKTNNITNKGIEEEIKIIMENLKSILTTANYSFHDVVKCSIFLTDMKYFKNVNNIYSSYLSEPYPARETIAVKELPKNANVEISAIAIKNKL